MPFGRRIRRARGGHYEIRLPNEERELLRVLAPQLRTLLEDDLADPSLRRLFPTAYADDPERDQEYQQLVRDELAERRRGSIDTLLRTVDATRLSEEEIEAWMGAVNDLRLVIGTRLDVSEDTEPVPAPDDPDAGLLALYGYLGVLLESIVAALSSGR
jgi:hypothetical protein